LLEIFFSIKNEIIAELIAKIVKKIPILINNKAFFLFLFIIEK
tara:strand:+ start:1160 stop:1288 length:129 start_codon:yes stop_codon:yes gene_type:complete